MKKWLSRGVVAFVVSVLVVVFVLLYVDAAACMDAGMVPVRGIFSMECIKK